MAWPAIGAPSSFFEMNGLAWIMTRPKSAHGVVQQTIFWSESEFPRSTWQLSDVYYSDTLATPFLCLCLDYRNLASLAYFSTTDYAFSKGFGVECVCSTSLCIYSILCYACSFCTYPPSLDHDPPPPPPVPPLLYSTQHGATFAYPPIIFATPGSVPQNTSTLPFHPCPNDVIRL